MNVASNSVYKNRKKKEMDIFDEREITIWEVIRSLSDLKEYLEKDRDCGEDLKELQKKLMESGEWLNKYTIE